MYFKWEIFRGKVERTCLFFFFLSSEFFRILLFFKILTTLFRWNFEIWREISWGWILTNLLLLRKSLLREAAKILVISLPCSINVFYWWEFRILRVICCTMKLNLGFTFYFPFSFSGCVFLSCFIYAKKVPVHSDLMARLVWARNWIWI